MAEKPILLSLKHGPRKHTLIVATDQSNQSSTYKTPCPVGFLFPFPSLRKGQCVVQAGELKGISLSPKCVTSPPPAPLNWHLMSRSQVCEVLWDVQVKPLGEQLEVWAWSLGKRLGSRGRSGSCQCGDRGEAMGRWNHPNTVGGVGRKKHLGWNPREDQI